MDVLEDPWVVAVVAALLGVLATSASRADAYIYWANNGSGTIGRASLDGSGANQSFVTAAPGVNGIEVDANHIYWADPAGAIGRADIDASNRDPAFISGASSPQDVAVDRAHIFWSNYSADTIGRANLDGSSPNQSFIALSTNASPGPLAVDALPAPETTITSGPEGTTGNASPSFGFSADQAGSTFECRLDTGAFSACTSPHTYVDLSDGAHSFEVRATNPEGATDPTPATRAFTVDTVVVGTVKAKRKQRQRDDQIRIKVKAKASEQLKVKASGKSTSIRPTS